MNYFSSYNLETENAYIISLKDNKISQDLTERCAKSCEKVGQPYKIFYGFDGNTGIVVPPEELKDQSWLNWLRLHDCTLTPTQIGCVFSHFALWTKCLEIDQPIIILEHDSIMLERFPLHPVFNSVIYLGSREQYHGSPVYPTPPHGSDNKGLYRFICRAHAYSIDPAVAKNLISYVLKMGIHTSLDVMLRSDIIPICQFGMYAYDEPGISTIHKEEWVKRLQERGLHYEYN
jgi:hypothetical protein